MASIGKKILSAFVDLSGDEKPSGKADYKKTTSSEEGLVTHDREQMYTPVPENQAKFTQYFDKLFKDANLPGPDYFEFSKMIEAMKSIPDEKSRYTAAFAGLNVQGLDKTKLLMTATEYLRILNTDASNFNSTVDEALKEKVHAKQKEIGDKTARIQQLTREIDQLQEQIATMHDEIRENEKKIEDNSGGYKMESEKMRAKIENDIEKIKQHIN